MIRPIRRLLIANRGEIACRIIETARKLGIATVAVQHRLDHKAPHAVLADEVMEIEGETPVGAYLDSSQLVRAAIQKGCDAIHPGYGFLSENASFASAVRDAGLIFVGPGADTIRLMGDKITAREFAVRHDVPVSPSVMADGDLSRFATEASQIGFPLLIKASAGGGGKGMSIVRSLDDLIERAELAAGEAGRYFGDNRIYAERYVERPRHIEVQVVGDGKGNVIHLGDRECSIQRRFQKIIEEAPSVNLPDNLRVAMIDSAVRLASAACYENVGTVEFIVAPDGAYYFLEMNTRLQVEHRVTEMVCGLDIVAMQLGIASGDGLPDQGSIQFTGNAIECRICAENPDRDFMPETGRVLGIVQPRQPWSIFDSGLSEGQVIGTNFDPMLAKLVAHGASRAEAVERMTQAIRCTTILGVVTNLDYLGRIIEHPGFVAGDLHTGFLVEHAPALGPQSLAVQERIDILIAAAMSNPGLQRLIDDVPEPYALAGGWRN
jgi:propionyl-CoA carboxylase alpha chain/3-methylcrotonyl-CoA carboxylase alpha subunit/acetyl-CoA/propionyl-CoA carboxylase biotin carboxyl carrier protein